MDQQILIIEDSPTQAAQLRHILEIHHYRVSAVSSGWEALAALAPHRPRPALIISDVIMPEMDGYELCRRIKADDRHRDIPVVLLTSLSDPRDVIRGLECGADSFITKPYSEEHLISQIERLVAGRFVTETAEPGEGLAVHFGAEDYVITADRRQILNLLLSTYETAIQQNRDLRAARDEVCGLNEQLEAANCEMEAANQDLKTANRELETANQDLEAFSYTVSHDLRSPLTGIDGFCQLLLDDSCTLSAEKTREFIGHIQSAADRMGQLITTILDFSKLTRKRLERETVDLGKLALSIAMELRSREPQRTVTFRISEGGVVTGDAQLLLVVLDNLIGNAWKYSGKRTDAVIEFGSLKKEGETVYFVRDNGAGFDMTYAGKLFTAFERLHDSEEFEGIGIGLATAKRIIQRHGGEIWAEGEEGKGATFYFTLG